MTPQDHFVEGRLTLDQASYDLLLQAAEKSYRSLKKEAAIRIIDHANRFNASDFHKVEDVAFQTSIKIPAPVNQRLNKCLYRGQYKVRTLVDEYSSRLTDHLLRYATISAVGVVQENSHAP